jgi:hypothetical protein
MLFQILNLGLKRKSEGIIEELSSGTRGLRYPQRLKELYLYYTRGPALASLRDSVSLILALYRYLRELDLGEQLAV